jgi:hypothetical protein
MTYAEFLAENGATPDEIKVLDVPAARKAYEKQQSLVAAAAAEQQKAADLVKRNQTWAQEVETQNQTYLRERDSARIDAAAAAARIAKMAELGLIEVAEKIEPGSTKTAATEGTFDPKVLEPYVTRDTLLSVAEQEGNAIATVQDIAYEHQLLFGSDPAKRLNFRALRQEAKERKVPFEQLWSEKYNVPAARDARAAKEKSEYETRIAAEAVTKWRSEHPETNPMLATPTISRTPFTGAVPSSAAKQPWQRSDAEKEQSRQAKVMTSLEKQGLVQ